jgi:hypothetical protein
MKKYYEATFTLNYGEPIGPLLVSKKFVDRLDTESLPKLIVLQNNKDEDTIFIIRNNIKVIGLHAYDFDEENGTFSDTFYEYTAVARRGGN